MLAPAQQQAVPDAIKDKIQPALKKTTATATKSQRATDMSTTINALLSLRDAVFNKSNWGSTTPSKQGTSSNSNSPLNLGILAATSSAALDECEDVLQNGPVQTITTASAGKNNNNGYLRERKLSSESESPVNGSPVNGHNHALNLQMTRTTNGIDGERVTTTELIDELNRIYPQEDFSLLRAACLKKEITFTKLPRNGFGGGSPNREDIQVLLLQQNDQYMQMLQQSGIFPSEMTGLTSLSEAAGSSRGQKYSSWLHPLAMAAAAAAAGGVPASTATSNGNGRTSNGVGKKRSSTSQSSNNNSFESHVFLSPKYPVSTLKPKTVAAALAASRYSPNENSIPNGRGKRAAGGGSRRKSRSKPMTIAYGYEDGTLEPSSLVEVTSTAESDLGIDLTTLDNRKNGGMHHREYQDDDSPLSGGENQDVLSAASMSLESYLREAESGSKVMLSAGGAESTTTTSSDEENMSEQEKKKRNILEAFASDPEVAGDARGVARKLKLNIRVVNKVLKEGPSKSLPALQVSNGCKKTVPTMMEDFGLNGSDHDAEATNNNYKSRGGGNRRKSAKPNQICDLQLQALEMPEEEEEQDPLDMVVPIKKRRVSSSSGA